MGHYATEEVDLEEEDNRGAPLASRADGKEGGASHVASDAAGLSSGDAIGGGGGGVDPAKVGTMADSSFFLLPLHEGLPPANVNG